MTLALLIIAAGVIALFVWWRFIRIARPALPPLELDEEDPLMLDAIRTAQQTLGRFRELIARSHRGAHVKVRFLSSSGQTEFLWAELRDLRSADVEVLYITPPVTHTGRLERVHTHPLDDIVDWKVETVHGLYEGGFTMRAMFVRAREQWGDLPPELASEERKYATGHAA